MAYGNSADPDQAVLEYKKQNLDRKEWNKLFFKFQNIYRMFPLWKKANTLDQSYLHWGCIHSP